MYPMNVANVQYQQPGNAPGPTHPNAMNPYQALLQRRLRNRRPRFPASSPRPLLPPTNRPVNIAAPPYPYEKREDPTLTGRDTGGGGIPSLLYALLRGESPWGGYRAAGTPIERLRYLLSLSGGE